MQSVLGNRSWRLAFALVAGFLVVSLPVPGHSQQVQGVQTLDHLALAALIDQRLADKWGKEVQPAPTASDAEFLRRVYLDLIGRIPRVAEVRAFLSDPSPRKRELVVEDLLANPLYVSHFGTTLQNLILPNSPNQQFRVFAGNFKTWLEQQLQKDVPYDQVVREILTASVPGQVQGRPAPPVMAQQGQLSPIAFYQANEQKPENLAANTARIFLGVKLECAQCHDHPFAQWSRDQFWGLAAFFSTVQPPQRFVPGQGVQKIDIKPREIKIPETNKVVKANFLDNKEPEWRDAEDPRVTLANWVTSAKNPYFARTTVNRIWGHLFGVGLIDPIDDEPTDENPVSHPQLLEELTQQFVAHRFDLKYLIRAIVNTKAYQRTSEQTHPSQANPRMFARMSVRGLTPEQLFDSVALATGYKDNAQANGRGAFFAPNSPRGDFLLRFASQERATEKETSILQALSLMNGKFIADATSLRTSTTLAAVCDAPFLSTQQKLETLFLATLSRLPRAEELARLSEYVQRGGARNDEHAALADVFWALLNSPEFVLNH